jgi:hypothetical protein
MNWFSSFLVYGVEKQVWGFTLTPIELLEEWILGYRSVGMMAIIVLTI